MGKRGEYLKGTYDVVHKTKYCGQKPPIYRSSYEKRLFYWADMNTNVLKWCSECIVIPYKYSIDGRMHKYYTDMYAEIRTKNGPVKRFIVEIKPLKQTQPPKRPANRSKKRTDRYLYEQQTYVKNLDKWKAAEQYCKKKGYEFKIVTEKDLWT